MGGGPPEGRHRRGAGDRQDCAHDEVDCRILQVRPHWQTQDLVREGRGEGEFLHRDAKSIINRLHERRRRHHLTNRDPEACAAPDLVERNYVPYLGRPEGTHTCACTDGRWVVDDSVGDFTAFGTVSGVSATFRCFSWSASSIWVPRSLPAAE